MLIVAIAWIYVASMMALTETSFIAGVMTFVFYGVAPLMLFLWLMGSAHRRRVARRKKALQQEKGD
jgi:hypothetical protein